MKKSLWISTALAAAAALVSGPAAAVGSATATITGFSIVFFDLDPSDGIDPALTFTYEQSGSYASVQSSSEYDSRSDWVSGNFMPSSATAMLAFGEASASTDASSANASGSVSGPGYVDSGYFSARGYGVDNGFTLTPWTGMKLTVTFDGTASTGPSSGNEYAYAQGELETSIYGGNGWESHSAYRQAYAGCGTQDGTACSGESNSFTGTFSVSYANFSDDAVEGYISANAHAFGGSSVPVPEPQTYLMLLAGLAGVSAVIRRRRTA